MPFLTAARPPQLKICWKYAPALLACEWLKGRDPYYYSCSLFRIFFKLQSENSMEVQIPVWQSAGRELRVPDGLNAMVQMEKVARILDKFTIEGLGDFILRCITYSPDHIEFEENEMPSDTSWLIFTYKRRIARPRPAKK